MSLIFNECRMSYSYFFINFGNSQIRICVNRNYDQVKCSSYDFINDFLNGERSQLKIFLHNQFCNLDIDIDTIKDSFILTCKTKDQTLIGGNCQFELSYKENEMEIDKFLEFMFPNDDYC